MLVQVIANLVVCACSGYEPKYKPLLFHTCTKHWSFMIGHTLKTLHHIAAPGFTLLQWCQCRMLIHHQLIYTL